ncbi:MAG: glycosyltransferase [Deltaproteobacteria bacterium]|nr:glycosyltransferase [Deltaproteobacteria bacterium]
MLAKVNSAALYGAVPDMRPYFANASAMIVPLFQGSGTRFKILEAFASRLPVISTALGAEGLTVKDGKHLLLAETAEEFVEAIASLWNDDHLAQSLAEHGLALVTHHYSQEVAAQRLAAALNSLA